MRWFALIATLAITTACGSTAAAPTPTRLATAPVIRTAAPTIACPSVPGQPSSKATIVLEKGGTIVIQLRPDKAPKTVSNFSSIANKGQYDGLTFHRVEKVPAPFVIQGGDPNGDGSGGGKQCTELSDLPFVKGAIGIARQPTPVEISNLNQFFICIGDCLFLNNMYTNFGTVISGQDVADKVVVGDKIKAIRVE